MRGKGHFTLLMKGKKVIGCYRADYSGTARIFRGKHRRTDDRCCHSEIKCLKDNLHRKNLHKFKIINVKFKQVQEKFIFSISKPCTDCKDTLSNYGVRGIYYFSNETDLVYETFNTMDTIYSSWIRGWGT